MPLEGIIQKKAVFLTGKGGIGKSMITAALGQYAAGRGKKVCLIESTSQDQIAPLFGLEPVGHRITNFCKNIDGINLDSTKNFRDFVVKHLGYERLFDKVFNHAITRSFTSVLPGLAELTLLGRIYYAAALDPAGYDLVIFDGHSSGHFYNLITTPEAILDIGLVGPIVKETQRIFDFYSDSANAGLLMVGNSEPLVISECIDFLPKLHEAKLIPLAGLIVNRYLNPEGVGEDLQNLVANGSPLAPVAQFVGQKVHNDVGALSNLCRIAEHSQLPVLFLKDLGAIQEPLPHHFGDRWLSMGERYEPI